jgi:hypothetical protein
MRKSRYSQVMVLVLESCCRDPGKQRKHLPCKNVVDSHQPLPSSTITIPKMKRITQFPLADGSRAIRSCSSPRLSSQLAQRCLHRSPPKPATVAPITASGPPPTAPIPSAEHVDSRVARRRKQAELLKKGQDLRAVASGKGGGTSKMKRFWKDVHVKKVDGRNLPLFSPS